MVHRVFANNLVLKLVALLLAILLWYSVSREPVAEIGLTVPIELHDVPKDVEVISEMPLQANVRLRGSDRLIRTLTPADVHPGVEIGGRALVGERVFDLTPGHVHVPDGLEVVQIQPAQIRLTFDRRATREVEVKPRVVGNLAPGYRLASVIAEPKVVQITGPASRVKAVTAAMTDPIDASGVIGRLPFSTTAYVSDPQIRVVGPQQVRVTVITEQDAATAQAQ
jgi:YbbR domain-containing protein